MASGEPRPQVSPLSRAPIRCAQPAARADIGMAGQTPHPVEGEFFNPELGSINCSHVLIAAAYI